MGHHDIWLIYDNKLCGVPSVGIEWSLDNDASNSAVLVASEAHAITLAVEGLLGVVFTVATLTDEAIDVGEVIYMRNVICTSKFDNKFLVYPIQKRDLYCEFD